ncbi:hypothetical protein SH601_16040 [Gracilibacillus sp. S3-1-1]|uniref:Uncharacterized protein n=1 Tax=Gracilibacillus pellucidus TaxID=3095368 RepID=A0ACC6M9C4_9BACI|nr:hypothetical protein [Gracilibacillus sp. S3-1-1]MDX8047478.1 hypothetical protein [Gracilibacillus sp. S3-1-1]
MKMEKSGWVVISLLAIFVIVISIYTKKPPIEEVLSGAIEEAEQQFQQNAKQPNEKLDSLSLYIPEGFEIDDQSNSNILLTKADKVYIVFYNSLESAKSKVNYEIAREANDDEWLTSFENQDRFGYIYIVEQADQFEIQIGVGGVKVTTLSNRDELTENIQDMMDIAISLEYEESGGI